MSEANLLIFGCVVSFIAAAGGYIYLRECYSAAEPPERAEVPPAESERDRLREVG